MWIDLEFFLAGLKNFFPCPGTSEWMGRTRRKDQSKRRWPGKLEIPLSYPDTKSLRFSSCPETVEELG